MAVSTGFMKFYSFFTLALPPIVSLSTFVALGVHSAKGLARGAARCFAALSLTGVQAA